MELEKSWKIGIYVLVGFLALWYFYNTVRTNTESNARVACKVEFFNLVPFDELVEKCKRVSEGKPDR